jgi:glycosyltransferase involved in cell wall biosynthesis
MSGGAGLRPLVSIVLPTYNRADTIERAIASVRAQTYPDWELIVVDDGSTDATVARVAGCDPRLKVIRQENQGTAGARNTGLRACTGAYIAFLDSDDEWLPHHLELCVAFLEAHPGEAFVSNELWEDLGSGRIVNHYRVEIAEWYPSTARAIHSRLFELPSGEQDDYLRVYSARLPIGAWGEAIVARTAYPNVFHYRGQIFESMRFGFLMCLQPTVIRREAVDAVGGFDTSYSAASDYGFTVELCRRFTANYLSIPACIKHELAGDGGALSEDHVATGKTGLICLQDLLRCLDHYWGDRRDTPEIRALRGLRELHIARVALARNERAIALQNLQSACRNYPELRQARNLYWLIRLLPGERLSCQIHNVFARAVSVAGRIRRNEMSVGSLVQKLAGRLGLA